MTPAERIARNNLRYQQIIASNYDEDSAAAQFPVAALSAPLESPQPSGAAPGARQFAMTHRATGLVTLVNALAYIAIDPRSNVVGYDVTLVPDSEAIPLPWDLPLILRRPGQAGRPA